MVTGEKSCSSSASDVISQTESQMPINNQLEQERNRIIKALTEDKEFIKNIVQPKTLLFQNLLIEANVVSEKFIQLQGWRNRYNKSSIAGNPMNTFLTAFASIDQQILLLVNSFSAFDANLTVASLNLQSYLNCIDVHYTLILENITKANKATSMKQLKAVRTPKSEWIKLMPNPNLQELSDEWNRLELQSNLAQCFRHMQAIIQFIASNGDL